MGSMPGKLRFRWVGPYWIIDNGNDTYQIGTLAREVIVTNKVQRRVIKLQEGKTMWSKFEKEIIAKFVTEDLSRMT